jgi:phosphoglucomutase
MCAHELSPGAPAVARDKQAQSTAGRLKTMSNSPLAGKPAPESMLVDVPQLMRAFHEEHPDPAAPDEGVAFGTSGHRGSALRRTFNEDHIVAITHAICDYRAAHGIDGPLFLGRDTHALSEPASRVACECLAARGVDARVAEGDAFTPTPVVSHAVIAANRGRREHLADAIVVTPSHNPPEDGGFKYDPPHGGPADTDVTSWIEARANELLRQGVKGLARVPYERARREGRVRPHDFATPYVDDLGGAIDLELVAASRVRLGADPMGGASVAYWGRIAERYGLNLEVVRPGVDPTFRFIPVDHDGKIRTDCSSPYAMANLLSIRDRFDLSFGNDADADRHGVVSRAGGLLPPNHFLSVCADYLFASRGWPSRAALGKTVVSSSILDRVARSRDRALVEVPVGFKWFVGGLSDGTMCFAGEESAGASLLRRDGSLWTTDKDGLVLNLLGAEILAKTQRDPAAYYASLEAKLGSSAYTRKDEPASAAQRARIKAITPESVRETTLAGDPIVQRLSRAPGNGAAIGGLKIVTVGGWFAIRPSGTEDVYKLYAESLRGREHLDEIVTQARAIVARLMA